MPHDELYNKLGPKKLVKRKPKLWAEQSNVTLVVGDGLRLRKRSTGLHVFVGRGRVGVGVGVGEGCWCQMAKALLKGIPCRLRRLLGTRFS